MAEKVTPMVLKVDLQCPCCYRKIKRILCKFPQVRDQMFDEKTNTVIITVVCCSPEKIRDKLCYKGGKVIKSIEIKDSAKPKQAEKKADGGGGGDKPKEAAPDKKKEGGDKPKEAAPDKKKEGSGGGDKPKIVVIEKPPEAAPAPAPAAEKPKSDGAPPPQEKPKSDGAAPPQEKPKDVPAKNPAPPMVEVAKAVEPVPAQGVPSIFPYFGPGYDAYGAGPYYRGYGYPPPQPQPYYGYGHGYGSGYGPGYGYARAGNVNRCDGYCEESAQTCTIM